MSHGKSVTWAGAWVIVQQTQSTCPHHMVLTPSYCILPTYKRMWKPVPPNMPRHNLRCNTVQATKRHFVRVELSTSFDTHFFYYTTERIESIAAVWPADGLRRSDLGKHSKHDLEYLLDRGELVCHTPGVGHVTCGGWTGGLASIAPDSAAKLKEQCKTPPASASASATLWSVLQPPPRTAFLTSLPNLSSHDLLIAISFSQQQPRTIDANR